MDWLPHDQIGTEMEDTETVDLKMFMLGDVSYCNITFLF